MQNKKRVNFPMVNHNTDTPVTECNHPIGMHDEVKVWFSGNYSLYCLKVGASMYPNSEAVRWTKCYPGATSDISIFREILHWHTKVTCKSPSALANIDHGEGYLDHLRHHTV